jgi:mono/diheme cytochrome c family protein
MTREKPRFAAGSIVCVLMALGFLSGAALIQGPALAETAGIFDPAQLTTTDGRQIYERICQGCHMADGKGALGAGRYPALAKDLALSSRQYMAVTILAGRRNMPAFGAKHAIAFEGPPMVLDETQIAAVTNYVRTHFENHYKDSITAAEVAALDRTLERQ